MRLQRQHAGQYRKSHVHLTSRRRSCHESGLDIYRWSMRAAVRLCSNAKTLHGANHAGLFMRAG
jgi:hypothetical protein